ncbi:MAG: hypothetical protein WBC51_16510 [Vicinamibacterales bacterium]
MPAVGAKREGGRSRFLPIAVVIAAIGVFVVVGTLPPKPVLVSGANPALVARTARGAIHVHTTRSDGLGDRSSVAAAARRAGLHFVVFTDHGDGMRPPDPPAYLDGVLCLDGVEISTDDGHYLAVGAGPSPFPLGGAGVSVVEDVRRLGGFGIAAHPTSKRRDLQWSDWSAPIDALEWLNADSEWRNESRLQLALLLVPYLFRPAGALSRVLDRPETALLNWDDLIQQRRLLGIAGSDAHGGLGNRVEDPSHRWSMRIPSYEASFRAFSTNIQLDRPLTGDAAPDAARLVDMLKAGRFYTEIDAVATGATLEFTGRTREESVEQGSLLRGEGVATFRAHAMLPRAAVIVAYTNGEVVAESRTGTLDFQSDQPGAHRVEVHVPGAPGSPPVPWLVSNPIFRLQPPAKAPAPAASVVGPLKLPAWRLEKDEGSQGTVRTNEAGGAEFAYKLRDGARASQFVALVTDVSDPPLFEAVTFSVRSTAPRRLSLQLRFARDADARWGKSVYVDATSRVVTVPVEQLRRADGPPARPPVQRATSLLFVVDLTNAAPGDAGQIEIGGVGLVSR